MEVLNNAEILMNLKKRFLNNIFFTYVGPTLIIVNSFKSSPILYTNQVRNYYINTILVKKL